MTKQYKYLVNNIYGLTINEIEKKWSDYYVWKKVFVLEEPVMGLIQWQKLVSNLEKYVEKGIVTDSLEQAKQKLKDFALEKIAYYKKACQEKKEELKSIEEDIRLYKTDIKELEGKLRKLD